MLRRFNTLALAALVVSCAGLFSTNASAATQKGGKEPTAEQVAETVILIYGSREGLAQIRKSGVERGRVTRNVEEGRTEETTYERRFVRGETAEKDKVRLDRKMPSVEYSLVYNEGRLWGIVNGTPFTPREEAVADFHTQRLHCIDALLRYKENGATVTYAGKEKQKNIEMWILDLDDKEKRRTRYYISSQTGRVLWLEYEDKPPGATAPIKYKRTFHDYRRPQGTTLPFRTVLYEDGKQREETLVLNVSYGVKLDDAYFKNSESAATVPTP